MQKENVYESEGGRKGRGRGRGIYKGTQKTFKQRQTYWSLPAGSLIILYDYQVEEGPEEEEEEEEVEQQQQQQWEEEEEEGEHNTTCLTLSDATVSARNSLQPVSILDVKKASLPYPRNAW